MPQYRVSVTITGVVRVQASSPEEAERIAAAADPSLAGKPLFGRRTVAQCQGPVETHDLDPDSVSQEFFSRSVQ